MATKIAFVGDVHVGNHKRFGGPKVAGINRRCQHILDTLKSAALSAAASQLDALVILGDLFDSPNPTPQMMRQVQECLEIMPTIVLSGNHDQCSDAIGDHALGPLMPVCEVVDAPDVIPIGDTDLILIPFESGNCREWLPKRARQLARLSEGKHRVLCFHAGIISDSTPEFLRTSDAAITSSDIGKLCDELDIGTAFAGHWHNKHESSFNGRRIIQAGALVPTGWNNPGFDYGTMYMCSFERSRSAVFRSSIAGPRFIDATPTTFDETSKHRKPKKLTEMTDDEIRGSMDNAMPMRTPEYAAYTTHSESHSQNKLYMRLHVAKNEVQLGQAILNAGIHSETIIDGELVLDKTATEETNKKAAQHTQSATTLEEALSAFVKAMALKGIDDFDAPEAKHEIHEKTKKYMDGNDAS